MAYAKINNIAAADIGKNFNIAISSCAKFTTQDYPSTTVACPVTSGLVGYF